MSDGPSSVSRAFQTFLERAPKHAGAWMAAVQALGEASALDKKTSALAYLAVLAALRLDSGVPFHVKLAKQAAVGVINHESRRGRVDRSQEGRHRVNRQPDALLLFGPGEAKRQLKDRLSRSQAPSERVVAVESTDKLTDPQIVAKVKEYYGIAR